jgi:hypothetical protein
MFSFDNLVNVCGLFLGTNFIKFCIILSVC